jgi:hypothetical protein
VRLRIQLTIVASSLISGLTRLIKGNSGCNGIKSVGCSKDSCSKQRSCSDARLISRETMFVYVRIYAPGVERESCLCRRATCARGDRWIPRYMMFRGANAHASVRRDGGCCKGARGCAVPCAHETSSHA